MNPCVICETADGVKTMATRQKQFITGCTFCFRSGEAVLLAADALTSWNAINPTFAQLNPCNQCNTAEHVEQLSDNAIYCRNCKSHYHIGVWNVYNPILGVMLLCLCGANGGWREWSHNKNSDTYGLTCGFCSRGTINQKSWQAAYDSWQEWMNRPTKKKAKKA